MPYFSSKTFFMRKKVATVNIENFYFLYTLRSFYIHPLIYMSPSCMIGFILVFHLYISCSITISFPILLPCST